MNYKLFRVGMVMGIPPWGILLRFAGPLACLIGTLIQSTGLVIMAINLIQSILKRKERYFRRGVLFLVELKGKSAASTGE
jgi:hypothetical protein